ncbi:DUF6233 domain-containing protein [Streptomyces mutabilis]|uniref:DUF6233 domain-containing protein n=1 Tax=Streptomyces mutabilis TaxID=67332 RepID=UPI003675B388
MLRFLERARLRDLERIRRWITEEEQREAEHRAASRRSPPRPTGSWNRASTQGSPSVYVHAGDCWNAGKRSESIDQEQARRALAGGVKAYRAAGRTARCACSTSGGRCRARRGGPRGRVGGARATSRTPPCSGCYTGSCSPRPALCVRLPDRRGGCVLEGADGRLGHCERSV